MNILYIGSGFVGTCSAAVSAASGHRTLVYDIDGQKIKKLSSGNRDEIESCLFEEGLSDLLIRNKDQISFTADYGEVENFLNDADAIFMCLPTPEIGETGESNLSYYLSAADSLAQGLIKKNNGQQTKYAVIVNKSTVPIDMINQTEAIMEKHGVKNYGVVSNPEFLVEGKAISGSLKPNRIVIGAKKEEDFAIMRKIYQRFYDSSGIKYLEVNPQEAAAGKLLANFLLFSKLALCFDVVGRTCETFSDLKFENIRQIVATDPRIGTWGLYDSLYAGGSCFIKDARSLSHQLQTQGSNAVIVNEVYFANKRQLELFLSRAKQEANFDWSNKIVALLGTAFKQDTNDVRNSASIDIGHFLKKEQVKEVRVYDPAGLKYYQQIFPPTEQFKYFTEAEESIKDSDVIIISTDWPQFKRLADVVIKLNKKPLIMDGRRLWHHCYHELSQAGFDIIAVGSPFIKGKK